MRKTVLDVGNCWLDRRAVRHLVETHFDARVDSVSGAGEALDALRRNTYDLVLVNRTFGGSQTAGVDLVTQIKSDPQLAATPVILLSNHPEAQQQAAAAGAEPGFGKAELEDEATRRRLAQFLG